MLGREGLCLVLHQYKVSIWLGDVCDTKKMGLKVHLELELNMPE